MDVNTREYPVMKEYIDQISRQYKSHPQNQSII